MEVFQAILLGIVEGLTEFIPVSSTGHLLIAQRLIGYKDLAEVFTVVVQSGAIAAVVWQYRVDLLGKVTGLFQNKKKVTNFWVCWVAATLPAGLAGLIVEKKFDTFATLPVIAAALIIGGFVILLIESRHSSSPASKNLSLEDISLKQAIQIGLYQIMALIPGVSRSGATIMGGLLSGVNRVTATAFSFYLSIPILVMAGAYKLIKDGDKLSYISGGSTALIAGLISSFITAFIVVKWLLRYVSSHDFKVFAYYRIAVGSLIFVVLVLR